MQRQAQDEQPPSPETDSTAAATAADLPPLPPPSPSSPPRALDLETHAAIEALLDRFRSVLSQTAAREVGKKGRRGREEGG